MASPIPAAAVGKLGGLTPGGLLQEVLGSLLVSGGLGLAQAATGALQPPAPQGSSGSKYMITLQDVKEIEKFVADENMRRQMLNMLPGREDLPMLNAQDIINEREAQLRISADEAGARELAKAQVQIPVAAIPAIAQAAGTGAQASSGVAQQFLQSYLSRPNIDPSLQTVAQGM
jgi:hypothetical protein